MNDTFKLSILLCLNAIFPFKCVNRYASFRILAKLENKNWDLEAQKICRLMQEIWTGLKKNLHMLDNKRLKVVHITAVDSMHVLPHNADSTC